QGLYRWIVRVAKTRDRNLVRLEQALQGLGREPVHLLLSVPKSCRAKTLLHRSARYPRRRRAQDGALKKTNRHAAGKVLHGGHCEGLAGASKPPLSARSTRPPNETPGYKAHRGHARRPSETEIGAHAGRGRGAPEIRG